MRVLDLFSGIGGFRIGFSLSGTVANDIVNTSYSDIDPYANKAYSSMFNCTNEKSLGDIQQHTRFLDEYGLQGSLPKSLKRDSIIDQNIPNIDILFAGFPCQPHSLMGNRNGKNDDRGNLFYDIAEIIRVKKPANFILENVKSITSVNNGIFFQEIIDILAVKLNYSVNVLCLNASDFGIPQTRRRVFIVGDRDKDISNLNIDDFKTDLRLSEYPSTWHLLEKEVDERYYLSEKILKTILKDKHKGYNRKAEINKLIARPLTKTMHKMHRASQDNYYSDSFIKGHYDKKEEKVILARLSKDRIRRITPREALRIQSFPENYIDKLLDTGISDTRIYMLAGNAVPPKLVEAVMKALFI